MARTKDSQSKHDAEINKIAKNLKAKGFEVKADVPGFQKPENIGGYRPDVVAQRGSRRKIVEVETPDPVSSAREVKQCKAFRDEAKQDPNTTFQRKVAK